MFILPAYVLGIVLFSRKAISLSFCFIRFVRQQNIGQNLRICYHGSVPIQLGEAVSRHILGFRVGTGVNPLVDSTDGH